MQQFSTFTCAGIPPRLVRIGRAEMSDDLGTEVLQFELAAVKRGRAKQILITVIAQGCWDFRRRTAIAKSRCDVLLVSSLCAQPEKRFGLQTAGPFNRDIDLLRSPLWNCFLEQL